MEELGTWKGANARIKIYSSTCHFAKGVINDQQPGMKPNMLKYKSRTNGVRVIKKQAGRGRLRSSG
jgi:hypothetical protein